MAIKCCKDCKPPLRHPGCHDRCEQYLKEKTAWDAEQAARRKQKDIDEGLKKQIISGVHKRRTGRKWRSESKPWD